MLQHWRSLYQPVGMLQRWCSLYQPVGMLQHWCSLYQPVGMLQRWWFHNVKPTRTDRSVCVFYVNLVDARSQVLLATYNDLAKDLAVEGLQPLAAIDCYSWTDACQLASVSAFPLIRVYRPNADFLPYSGYLSKAALYTSIKLYVFFCALYL